MQHHRGHVKVADRKDRMAAGTHQTDERLAYLRIGRVLHIEDAVQHAVHRQQDAGAVDQPEGDAHVHQLHQVAAAAEDHARVDHAFHAAAGQILKVLDLPHDAVVALHQVGKALGHAAAAGDEHAAGVGDDALGLGVGKDAHLLDLHAAVREEVAVGDDEVAAAAHVAGPGPAGNRRTAGADAEGAGEVGEGKAQQRAERHGRAQQHRKDIDQIFQIAGERRGQQREQGDQRQHGQAHLLKQGLVGGRLLAAADKAGVGALGFEDGGAALLHAHLSRDRIGPLGDGRHAQRFAQAAAAEQGGQQHAGQRQRGEQAQRHVRLRQLSGADQQRVKAGDKAGQHRHRIRTEAAADGVEHAAGQHVLAQQHHRALDGQAEPGRHADIAELTEHGQAQGDPGQHRQQHAAQAQAQPHRADKAPVVARGVGGRCLGAEILVVLLGGHQGFGALAQTVEGRGRQGTQVFFEVCGEKAVLFQRDARVAVLGDRAFLRRVRINGGRGAGVGKQRGVFPRGCSARPARGKARLLRRFFRFVIARFLFARFLRPLCRGHFFLRLRRRSIGQRLSGLRLRSGTGDVLGRLFLAGQDQLLRLGNFDFAGCLAPLGLLPLLLPAPGRKLVAHFLKELRRRRLVRAFFLLVKGVDVGGNEALGLRRLIAFVGAVVHVRAAVAQAAALSAALRRDEALVHRGRLRPGLAPRLEGGLRLAPGIGGEIRAHLFLGGQAAAPRCGLLRRDLKVPGRRVLLVFVDDIVQSKAAALLRHGSCLAHDLFCPLSVQLLWRSTSYMTIAAAAEALRELI